MKTVYGELFWAGVDLLEVGLRVIAIIAGTLFLVDGVPHVHTDHGMLECLMGYALLRTWD